MYITLAFPYYYISNRYTKLLEVGAIPRYILVVPVVRVRIFLSTCLLSSVSSHKCHLQRNSQRNNKGSFNLHGKMKTVYLVTRNTIKSRWMVVPAGFFIMAVSGAFYAFGVYSGAVKTALNYNQKTLNTIGFFKDFGNIGIFAGIIADLFPAWVVLSVGVAFNTFGYSMIWLAVTKKIAKPALWQMYVYITTGGNSVAFTHAGALVTCVKNFPLHRGMIVGLLKGFLGLSAAILTLIYRAIYGNKPSSFILLIVYIPLVVILVFMFFIRPLPLPSDEGRIEDEAKVFYRLLGFEVSVALYLMVVILIQHEVGVQKVVNGVFAWALAALMFAPVGLVAWMEYQKLRRNRVAADVETNVKQLAGGEEVNNGLAKIQTKDSPDESPEEEEEPEPIRETNTGNNPKKGLVRRLLDALRAPPVGQDFTVWQALLHPYFWLLAVPSTGGLGAGLMLIDNFGQVGAAYGYDAEKTGTFVSLISIWNCLGRVGVGFLSEFFLQKYGLARPFFFAVALALSAFGYLAIALNWPGALFIGSILIGLCFGAQLSLLHIIVSEIFGLKYYGTLQSIIIMASPLGTYLLSVRVAGYMYDKEADRQRATTHVSDLACQGTVCYKKSLLIMCAACTAGCLLTLLMAWHTQRFYKREVYERLKAKRIEMAKAKQEEAARLNGK